MPDATPPPKITPPMLRDAQDEATVMLMLVIDAMALLRQWKFLLENPQTVLTPKAGVDLREEREQWLERANRWSKNKPEYQVPDL